MRSVFCTAYIIKMALTSLLMVGIIFMCLSRVYLGAHSYDQVIFGTSIGTTFIFIIHFFLSSKAKTFVQELRIPHKGNFIFNVSSVLIMLIFVCTSVLPLALAYALYLYKMSSYVPNFEWN
mmetsp:Transcript_28903/g.21527  ORF Transcript_28903/g.21527 Transcript_28903/m.21527 type:complete len:121 (+) Transcript_28903:437-799(+)